MSKSTPNTVEDIELNDINHNRQTSFASPPTSPRKSSVSSAWRTSAPVHQRRRSFIDKLVYRAPTQDDDSNEEKFRLNFHFINIGGMHPSKFTQYRIVVQPKDIRKVLTSTPWRASSTPQFLIEETSETFMAPRSCSLVFKLESRFERSSTIGESDAMAVTELLQKQEECGHREFFYITIHAKGKLESLSLKMNVRQLPVARDLSTLRRTRLLDDEAEHLSSLVYEDNPKMMANTVEKLDQFVLMAKDSSVYTSCALSAEFVHHTYRYIQENKRRKMTYSIEDSIWTVMNGASKEMGVANMSRLKYAYMKVLLTILIRAFVYIRHLHVTREMSSDHQIREFILQELRQMTPSFPIDRSKLSGDDEITELLEPFTDLSNFEMRLPRVLTDGGFSLDNNHILQEIIRWMADTRPARSVYWLHGEFGNGAKENPTAATLVEFCKATGIPLAYLSVDQFAAKQKNTHQESITADRESILNTVTDSIVYQLARCDHLLERIFKAVLEQPGALNIHDPRQRFQTLFATPLSLLKDEFHLKFHPILILIDDFKPSRPNTLDSSLEYKQLLNLFSSFSCTPNSEKSLPLPSFVRFVVFSQSLGDDPAMIEKFACVRDAPPAAPFIDNPSMKLHHMAVDKGKGKAVEVIPTVPILEADAQIGVPCN